MRSLCTRAEREGAQGDGSAPDGGWGTSKRRRQKTTRVRGAACTRGDRRTTHPLQIDTVAGVLRDRLSHQPAVVAPTQPTLPATSEKGGRNASKRNAANSVLVWSCTALMQPHREWAGSTEPRKRWNGSESLAVVAGGTIAIHPPPPARPPSSPSANPFEHPQPQTPTCARCIGTLKPHALCTSRA